MSVIENNSQLLEKVIPEVLFTLSSSGVTISSPRLLTTRFVEFDMTGKCKSCKGENVDIDFIVTPKDVTLYCNRLKSEKVVMFDHIYEIPQQCVFRVKSKGKNFNILHKEQIWNKKQFINGNEQMTVKEFLSKFSQKQVQVDKEETKGNIKTDDKENISELPFGCIISGPSSTGKSTFVRKLISNSDQLIDPIPKSILYCYGEYNSLVPELQRVGISVYAGVPPEDLIKKQEKPSIVILDDLMYTIDEKYLSELFTKKSHHLNFGIIFITQNLFEKKLKVARQNSMYIVLTRAPNSALAVRNLGVQLFPGRLNYFLDAYRQATSSSNYSYLFIDLHPSSDPILRLRTNIFIDKESEVLCMGVSP
uniref:Uncharacterized protein n=1 Tax=Meloidogyne enterolobii TaxID=390850 RepID=A0A6V7URG5_MELEN|nr:unnamed protein product [Meloidogyne enterolobii]